MRTPKDKFYSEDDFLKFYNQFTEEELATFPPLDEKYIGIEENVFWDGEKWQYAMCDM